MDATTTKGDESQEASDQIMSGIDRSTSIVRIYGIVYLQ
jgi:hypothetical protein